MLAFANAKINLGLHLLARRDDGYHLLETVFYPIKLNDVIEIIDAEETSCVIRGLDIPGNPNENIALTAFKRLQLEFDLPPQQLVILKNIPVGAGLGGGSSDAAFTIKLVNDKFNLGLSVSKMQDYARGLGADCAFFVENKPVFAKGIGDEFEAFEIDLSPYYLVLVKPPVHVSTAEAYSRVVLQPSVSSLKQSLAQPEEAWRDGVFNDFERSVFTRYPQIDEIKTRLYQAGAIFALMSGSGSSVFALFKGPVQLPELEKTNQVFYNIG